jgi:F0F1-type ATP synthase assembly protein I
VQDAVAESLRHWESFYVIVGSSAAALTGLQFVVVALVAESHRRSTTREIDAFATPTIVHFCAVLLIAAVLSAPWHALSSAALVLGVCGAAGVGYTGIVTRRARRQTGYRPVLEDWLWHSAFPFVAYTTLLSAALALARHATGALFMIGAAALVLLFIGIHNAWDTVTYVAVERVGAGQENEDRR